MYVALAYDVFANDDDALEAVVDAAERVCLLFMEIFLLYVRFLRKYAFF